MNYLPPRINRLEKELRFVSKKTVTYLIYEKDDKYYEDFYCTKEWIELEEDLNTSVVRVIYIVATKLYWAGGQ